MARSFAGTISSFIALNSLFKIGGTFPAAKFSIACWINPTSVSGNQCLVGGLANEIEFRLGGNQLNLLQQFVAQVGASSGTVTAGVWSHVGVAYDGSNYAFYVNGSPSGSGASSQAINQSTNLDIGKPAEPASTEYYTGFIADFAVWNTILTPAEFSALGQGIRPYRVRRTLFTGWLPLDGLQSPEPDFSGQVFNGTLTGTVAVTGPPVTLFTPQWASSLAIPPSIPLMGSTRLLRI